MKVHFLEKLALFCQGWYKTTGETHDPGGLESLPYMMW